MWFRLFSSNVICGILRLKKQVFAVFIAGREAEGDETFAVI